MVSAVRRVSARSAKRKVELTDILSSDSENEYKDAETHGSESDAAEPQTSDPDSDSDHSEDGPEVQEPEKPSRNTKRRRLTKAASDFQENQLFKALSSPDVEVSELALEWVESYAEDELNDETNAITELFNLVLRCCGCVHLAQNHDMINSDSAGDTVAEVGLLFEKQRYHEYPFVSTNKSIKFFRRNVVEFFESLVVVSHEKGMLYSLEPESSSSTSPMMNSVLTWLTLLSSSNVRPFRYVSTVILMAVQTMLCEQSVSLIVSLEKQQRQLSNARNNKSRNQRAQQRKIEIISECIDKFSRQNDTIAEYLVDIFQNVFVRRYRDVDSGVRVECVKALGQWMVIHEEQFLQAKYLRYFGWLLSDPSENVREEVVKSLHKLYKHIISRGESMGMGFRQFTDRFKKQYINMIWRETHSGVKTNLLSIYQEIYKLGFLDDKDITEIGLYGFYLAEAPSKHDKIKLEWCKLVSLICTANNDKETEKYSAFLSSHVSNIFGDEDQQLSVDNCIRFKILGDFFEKSHSLYVLSKRSTVSVLLDIMDFHEMLVLLFGTMYSLPEFQGTWNFLVRYFLCDVSSATFHTEDSDEDHVSSTQGEDLKERLEITSSSERANFLCFIAGAFSHIVLKKSNRKLEDSESQDNVNVALPMIAQYLHRLEKILSESPKLYAVFMIFWNTILIPISRSLASIYNNGAQIEEYNTLHGSILQFYGDVENFDNALQKVFDQYFSLLLKNFDSQGSADDLDSVTVLNSSITLKVEDLLISLSAETIISFNSKDLIEAFDADDDDTILPEDQKVLCNRMLKAATPLQKLSHLAKVVNINKYIAEPILDFESSLLEYVSIKFLSKIDFVSLIKLWPNNYLQMLSQMQQSWSAILDIILMSICWKLEDLMYASNDNSAALISVDLVLEDFNEILVSLCLIFMDVQTSFRSLNETVSESNQSMMQLVGNLVDLSKTFADYLIDACVSLRVFYLRLRDGNSFKNFDAFFSNMDGVGRFVQENIPADLQSAFLNVFLIQEARVAKLLSVNLERRDNEDVDFDDYCFDAPIVMDEPVQIEETEFGGSDDEEDVILGKVDPRVEAEARETEAESRAATRKANQLWAVQKELLVYVVKMLSLAKTGGFSDEVVSRIELNASALGPLFEKVLAEANVSVESPEAGVSTP